MKNYIGISRDHSGSMRNIALAAGRDYNDNIASIKEEAEKHNIDTIVSVVKCGVGRPGRVEVESLNSSINALKPIPDYSYVASGSSTPLFDSVGELITQFERVPDFNNPEVSFLIMIITDGQENDSRKWNAHSISRKINQLQATDKWSFAFRVPRGMKSYLVSLGIPEGNILEWDQTDRGVQEASVATRSAFTNYYQDRSQGITKTASFYANLGDVNIKQIKNNLVDISKEVYLFAVNSQDAGRQIREFVESKTKGVYKKGMAFYQLTKSETLQDYKLIVIRDKVKGSIYSGFAARDLLGLPKAGEVKLRPGNHGQYDIFIQSTSVNRKLMENTNILVWPNVNM
jgi:hypothetical protein